MCFDLYGSSLNLNESTKPNFTNLEPSNRVAIFAAVMASICSFAGATGNILTISMHSNH